MTTKTIKILPALLLSVALVMSAALPARAVIRPGVKYVEGGLTLEAKNATVGELLETIARTAGVDVFVGRDFQAKQERITLSLEGEPLEDALKRILRGYNYAAIYEKEGNDFRISALKIYPEGKMSGAVVPLFTGGRTPIFEEKTRRGETVTVLVNANGGYATHGSAANRRGVVGPSETVVTDSGSLNAPWLAVQLQHEQEESRSFADLLMLKKQAEIATEPNQKQALTMAYADGVAKFQAFKKANMNKVESLKRIGMAREVQQ